MKKLSTIYKELGVDFTFPIRIKDSNGDITYHESKYGPWFKYEYDDNGNRTYYENDIGIKRGTPKSAKTCEGKVLEVDGIKYKLKLI